MSEPKPEPIKIHFVKEYQAHCKEYGVSISAFAPCLQDAKKKLSDFFTHINECGLEIIFHDELAHSEEENRCQSCDRPGAEPHPCPFKDEIHGDNTTLCNCCESCSHECAMDI